MGILTVIRLLWDRLAAWAAILAGFIAIILGVIGVRDNAYVAAQLPYIISGGILGLFLLGLGATLWLSADLRDQWRSLLRIREVLESQGSSPTTKPETREVNGSAPPRSRSSSRASAAESPSVKVRAARVKAEE